MKGLDQDDVIHDSESAGEADILNLSHDAHVFVGGVPPDVKVSLLQGS